VKAEDNSSIDDDLVSVFGTVHLGENVVVGKDLVSVCGSLHTPDSVSVGENRVQQSGWFIFIPLLVVLLVVLLIVRSYRAYRRRLILQGYQFPPKE
jgi:hypothetical protein